MATKVRRPTLRYLSHGFLVALALSACAYKRVARKGGAQSFSVEVLRPEGENALGSKLTPIPYAGNAAPFRIDLKVQAIGWDGKPDTSYEGRLLIDARPGVVFPNEFNVLKGEGTVSIQLSNAFGPTHIWLEDCGVRRVPKKANCTLEERQAYLPECLQTFQPGTLATGVSPTIYFSQPSIPQIQATFDNTTSSLISLQGDRCASLADPRYVDTTNLTGQQLLGVPRAQRIAPVGNMVNVTAGEMIVTAIDNEGFYLSDMSPEAVAGGFNGLFVFNFNYPEGLQVGDRLLQLQGVPSEFSGSTQLTNPFWIRDTGGPYRDKLPKPFFISPQLYQASIGRTGANINTQLDLERLEGGLVCMENLVVPGRFQLCDLNKDGRIDRFGETDEKACETACYNDPNCFEGSSYGQFQQWGALVGGIDLAVVCNDDMPCVEGSFCNPNTNTCNAVQKIALSTSNAIPAFRPDTYVADKLAKGEAPETMAVTGNLLQVLASRPVWLIQPRGAEDVVFGGTCPR